MATLITLTWFGYLYLTFTLVNGFKYPPYEPRYGYPLVRNKPYSFPTYAPIALISSSATPVSLPTLELHVYKNSTLLAQNGVRPVFRPYDDEAPAITLTGGPVFRDKYVLASAVYDCNGVPVDFVRTTDTQDGVGYPIQFVLVFYNKLYKSFNNSLNYRDGLFLISFPVIVEGNVDNVLFYPVQKLLHKIRKHNSSATISTGNAFHWLLTTLTAGVPYYSYPAAYPDSTGKLRFCANGVTSKFSTKSWISFAQYDVFTRVLNAFDQRQVRATPAYPLGPRPIVEAWSPICVKYYGASQHYSPYTQHDIK